MTIDELGEARFAKHEKALERALGDAVKAPGRVRHIFKVAAVAAGSITGDVAQSTGSDIDLNPASVDNPTEYLRRTPLEIPLDSRRDDLSAIGEAFITETLLSEDRALIDALDESEPEQVALQGDWIRAVCGPSASGGVAASPLDRVLLACAPIPGADEFAIREQGVKIVYPDVGIREYCATRPAPIAVGYLLREPTPDSVKLKLEADWRLLRRTTSTSVRLFLQATWDIGIEAEAVIRIHR